jgi:hypothetical protein
MSESITVVSTHAISHGSPMFVRQRSGQRGVPAASIVIKNINTKHHQNEYEKYHVKVVVPFYRSTHITNPSNIVLTCVISFLLQQKQNDLIMNTYALQQHKQKVKKTRASR